jgi:hypothetical protein
MQDEVAKHTRKIYKAMKEPGHSFWEKTKEVLIEIFIIVFAVTLSIWLHNWADHRHEQQEADEFEKGLKADLEKDISLMEDNRRDIQQVDSNFKFLRMLYESGRLDTASDGLLSHYLDFQLRSTHPNIGRYEGFKSSGKMGTIENDSLKQKILVYYQQTMPGVNDIEEVANSFQTKIMDQELNKPEHQPFRELIRSFKLYASLQFATGNLEQQASAYQDAITQAKAIIVLLN